MTSTRRRQDTLQEVTWTFKKTENGATITRRFSVERTLDTEIVILSEAALEKEYREHLNNLIK